MISQLFFFALVFAAAAATTAIIVIGVEFSCEFFIRSRYKMYMQIKSY